MGDRSKIEWCDATWNPVTGCTKVSAGCKFCYAERIFNRPYPGRAFTDVRIHPERLEDPLHWKKPRLIFVNSMSDLFHESIPASFVVNCFEVMSEAKQHTFQILTKRPDRIGPVLFGEPGKFYLGGGDYLSNVLIGVSVENQDTADERVPKLLSCGWVGRFFVSYEPGLGPVEFTQGRKWLQKIRVMSPDPDQLTPYVRPGLDWVIAGGESGPAARPSHPDWFRSVRDQCQAAGVPFFFKQWGEWQPWRDARGFVNKLPVARVQRGDTPANVIEWLDMVRVGKKQAGRLLDGREWNEFPEIQISDGSSETR